MIGKILMILGVWVLGRILFKAYAFYKKWKEIKSQLQKGHQQNQSPEVVKQVDGVDVILNPEKHKSGKSTFKEADNTSYTEI